LVTRLQLAPGAQKIVDALKDVLGEVFVILIDDAEKSLHLSMSRGWMSCQGTRADVESRGCHLEVPINVRWSIHVATKREPSLNPNVKQLLTWAAMKLAPHLPSRSAVDFLDPPTGGSGGPPGSAEVGIPVWWARRARN
jgi:hypothetical protein